MSERILKCRFHPQAWINDYAHKVDPEGPTDFEVRFLGPVPIDDDYPSDDLRHDAAAPQWIKDWVGPFYVEILNRMDLELEQEEPANG